jgi:DNA polymerase-3 subunit delta'
MKDILINQGTKKIIDSLCHRLPQSLLLFGEPGVGLSVISKYITDCFDTKPTIILPEKDDKIDLEKGIVSVDIMRRLYSDTKTVASKKRFIVIDYAERMTHQAQNAFLKLLEEPGRNTHFILLSHSTANILPTIMSRVEKVNIKPISTKQSNELLDKLGVDDKTKRAQLLYIASGLPAELTRLSSDKQYFESRVIIIRDAREILSGKPYQKLLTIQRYKDSRASALILLTDMAHILRLSISSGQSHETINKIDTILKVYQQIESNCNIRLCLAQLIA